ncbi:unnamed protein product, partial [Mesorhabditis belari]|uniref:Uncharacterized protein n=1 Tax=Mesorhabditis belari TaxID=2138241 RepID=A0AAF3FJL4_9BILA
MPYVGVGAQKRAAESLCGPPMLKVYLSMALGVFLTVLVALLGKYHSENPSIQPRPETLEDYHSQVANKLSDNINAENIKEYLRVFTREPHVAGTENNKKVAHAIADLWTTIGLEDVRLIPYDVLLSYPNWDQPNKVFIKNGAQTVFESTGVSPVIIPDEQSGKYAGHQWVAWAAPGVVTGEVVFCNRGHEADFENLKKMGVSVEGKIALLRYGDGFRGDKVKIAQDYGAIGAILYSDPADVATDGTDQSHVYPNTVWMPNEGVQRGSIMHGDGDPLTPLYPAKTEIYKSRTIEQAKKARVIPTIPVLPISYTTAWQIISRMKGRPVPKPWQGGLNVTYRTGPGLNNGLTLTIDVKSELKSRKIRNVIGYIRGRDEPDRYVILGNHFDAWVYGSIDPNDGTAILSEVARSMVATMNQTGWRPARTIIFMSWDAEEFGLIGSTEFVEEFLDVLQKRAVVYINMDCMTGNRSLMVNTVPALYDVAVSAAKTITNPSKSEIDRGRKTVFDTWLKYWPDSKRKGRPLMPVPGGGSDHAPFLTYAGVPVIDFSYNNASKKDYALYHSLYETPFVNEHLLDPDHFAFHKAVGQMWGELARRFADEVILPFNVTDLAATIMKVYMQDLRNAINPLMYFKEAISDAKQQLTNLGTAATEFYTVASQFNTTITLARSAFEQNPYDPRHVNAINERIMGIERCFINPRGMAGAPQSRHVLFSISSKDSYSGLEMASVFDAVAAFSAAKSAAEREEAGRELAQQISIVQYSVMCATNILRDHI